MKSDFLLEMYKIMQISTLAPARLYQWSTGKHTVFEYSPLVPAVVLRDLLHKQR